MREHAPSVEVEEDLAPDRPADEGAGRLIGRVRRGECAHHCLLLVRPDLLARDRHGASRRAEPALRLLPRHPASARVEVAGEPIGRAGSQPQHEGENHQPGESAPDCGRRAAPQSHLRTHPQDHICTALARFSAAVSDVFAFDEIKHLLTNVGRMVRNALQGLRGENQTNAPCHEIGVRGPLFKEVTERLSVHRIDLIVQPDDGLCCVDILLLEGPSAS